MATITTEIPAVFKELKKHYRYKIYSSGRGAAKSWSFARVLLSKSLEERALILCCREIQNSIQDSVHRLLVEQIRTLGLSEHFRITATRIDCLETDSQFIFKGLRNLKSAQGVQSIEGIKYCWIEEAQSVSQDSLDVLIPTVRVDNSEIWFSMNPCFSTDAVWQMFFSQGKKLPPSALVKQISWRDNPFLPDTLAEQMILDLHTRSFGKFLHTWEGELKTSGGGVFRRDWWRTWPQAEPINYDLTFIAADTPYYQGAADKYAVLQLWGFNRDCLDLLDCRRGRWTVLELIGQLNALVDFAKQSGIYGGVVVEDTIANQTLLKILDSGKYAHLRYDQGHSDSLSRAYSATQYVSSGSLRLPEKAPWLPEFFDETCAYQDDDSHYYTRQVNAMTLACDVWRRTITAGK